ncbi:MAG TPA: TonB family protein [Dissulfurispiraceae bacterium]|nr:TonB family protein [Dissulfurispiraceae bacterium]
MKEQIRGFQLSFLAHIIVVAGLWALSMSAVTVSRPIEIDFGMVKEDAPKAVEQTRHVRKEPAKTFARPEIVEQQLTPSVSENAVPVMTPKPVAAEESRNSPAPGASAAVNRGSLENVAFGSVMGPNFLHRQTPVYPFLAKRMNKEGKVVLRLTIDEHGRLVNTEVVEASGFGFTEAAVDAVKKSTYRPAKRDGVAVLSRAILPIRFELKTMN